MKRTTSLVLLLVLAAALLLGSCGGMAPNSGGSAPESGSQVQMSDSASGGGMNAPFVPAQQELILTYRARILLETEQYDADYGALLSAIEAAGGYVEGQSSSGGYETSSGYARRYTELAIRIPTEQYAAFLEGAGQFGTVIRMESEQEDITAGYLDTEARVASLEAQRQRLTELLEQAANVSELLEIESRLSEVIAELESAESRMQVYRSLASYSSISLELREVSRERVGFGSRLLDALQTSWTDLLYNLEQGLFGLLYLLPYLFILFLLRRPLAALFGKLRRSLKPKKAEDPEQKPKES